jgi:hypothetical protein
MYKNSPYFIEIFEVLNIQSFDVQKKIVRIFMRGPVYYYNYYWINIIIFYKI